MIKDIFERIKETPGPLGQYQGIGDGYFMFPRLVGEIGPEMEFNGKPVDVTYVMDGGCDTVAKIEVDGEVVSEGVNILPKDKIGKAIRVTLK